MRLSGKTGIITGASSGIGAAAVRLFAREGAALVITARREDPLHALRDSCPEPSRIIVVAGDTCLEETHKACVDAAMRSFGQLDFGFNNAGMTGPNAPLTELAEDAWRSVLDTNLNSAYYASKYQLPIMQTAQKGSLVFTSSFVGHTIGLPGMSAYAAAKAGLIGLTQVLASEVGSDGVRVNALLPGGTMTEMAGTDANFHAFVRGLHALKRMAEPEEIAQAALFLVSDDSSFVTGTALLADGGNSICKT